MKKLSFCFALLLAAAAVQAQFNGALIIGPQASSVSPAFTYLPDTALRSSTKKAGIRLGILTHIPLSSRLQIQTGIIYSAKGSTEQQVFDENNTGLKSATTTLSVNYIDAPINLLLKWPLKGKTKFLIGAGPQLSLFYTGNFTHSLIDTDGKFREIKNEDLPVGKGDGQFRTIYASANALAGFEIGRVFITAHYARGLGAFYQKDSENFTLTTLGATLGIHLGKQQKMELVVKDRDSDGVPDGEDACPTEAGSAITKGCPDGDGDGITDGEDTCPATAGLVKYRGCPIPDSDKDGLNDEADRCPDVAGLGKYGGCPMPDKDNDGIADEEDACPDKAGTASNRDCPQVTAKEIEKVKFVATRLQFDYQSASITTSSYSALDEVVTILKAFSHANVIVEGHTAGVANEANLKLSQQRADAVKTYLVSKGIAAQRLTAIGYGATQPVEKDIASPLNRRVEIKLSE